MLHSYIQYIFIKKQTSISNKYFNFISYYLKPNYKTIKAVKITVFNI